MVVDELLVAGKLVPRSVVTLAFFFAQEKHKYVPLLVLFSAHRKKPRAFVCVQQGSRRRARCTFGVRLLSENIYIQAVPEKRY